MDLGNNENKENLTVLMRVSYHLISWNAIRHCFWHKSNSRTFLLVAFEFSFCQLPPSTLLAHYLFEELHARSSKPSLRTPIKACAASDVSNERHVLLTEVVINCDPSTHRGSFVSDTVL